MKEEKKVLIESDPNSIQKQKLVYITTKKEKPEIVSFITLFHKERYKQEYNKPKRISLDTGNKEKEDLEIYSIEGIFNAEDNRWENAEIRARNIKTLEEKIIKIEGLNFSLEKDDKLYYNGKRIFPLND